MIGSEIESEKKQLLGHGVVVEVVLNQAAAERCILILRIRLQYLRQSGGMQHINISLPRNITRFLSRVSNDVCTYSGPLKGTVSI